MQAVGRPGVQLLVDLFHFDLEQEPLSVISPTKAIWATATLPAPGTTACCPSPGTGRTISPFFQALQSIGYTGRLSLEGDTRGGLWQARSSLAYVKRIGSGKPAYNP